MVTIRNNSLELEDGDTISVDGTELTFRSSGELEFPDGEKFISLSDIDGADIAPNSVDVNTLKAGGFNFIGEFETLSDFNASAEPGDRGYITEEQQFARQI